MSSPADEGLEDRVWTVELRFEVGSWFALWFTDRADGPPFLTRDGYVLTVRTPESVSATLAPLLPPGYPLSRDPVTTVDLAALIECLHGPHDDEGRDLLTSLNLLDDLLIVAVDRDAVGVSQLGQELRKTLEPVRLALFEGKSLTDTLEAAGGPYVVQRAIVSAAGVIGQSARQA